MYIIKIRFYPYFSSSSDDFDVHVQIPSGRFHKLINSVSTSFYLINNIISEFYQILPITY